MAAVPQPRPGGRDVVGGALADRLHQHLQPGEVVAVPRRERLEQLEPLGVGRRRRRRPIDGSSAGGLEAGLAGVEALGRAARRPTAARAAPRCRRRAVTGSCTKSTSSRPVSAIAVTVSGEPMNDSVAALPSLRAGKLRLNDETIVLRLARLDVVALPLPDARAARVGEHGRADRLEVGEQAVALDRGAHLLGARRDEQRRLHPQAGGAAPGARRARRGRCPRTTSSCTSRRARSDVDRVALLAAASPTSEIGRSRSGVCGPTRCGSSSSRSMSITRSKKRSGSSIDLGVDAEVLGVRVGEVGERLAAGRLQVRGRRVRRRGTASTWRRSRRPCCRSWPCRWPRSTRRRGRSTRRSRRCRPSP